MKTSLLFLAIWTSLWLSPSVTANDTEISALLTNIEQSQCKFIRNGSTHSPEKATNHLRNKWAKGKQYIRSSEQFITRIASRSSITRKPYQILCENEKIINTQEWLMLQLQQVRGVNQ